MIRIIVRGDVHSRYSERRVRLRERTVALRVVDCANVITDLVQSIQQTNYAFACVTVAI